MAGSGRCLLCQNGRPQSKVVASGQSRGGPRHPALPAIEIRARLTPSERETALLAAAGRSNREIAAQLFLSSRTIGNRLQRLYEKLGISGLAETLELND